MSGVDRVRTTPGRRAKFAILESLKTKSGANGDRFGGLVEVGTDVRAHEDIIRPEEQRCSAAMDNA